MSVQVRSRSVRQAVQVPTGDGPDSLSAWFDLTVTLSGTPWYIIRIARGEERGWGVTIVLDGEATAYPGDWIVVENNGVTILTDLEMMQQYQTVAAIPSPVGVLTT